ncbi:MAG: DUF1345 domain-containing protein [Chloroflexi bacterium]|nr:DUF1345 domain-containing protein [Chloroflexota bacterium]
MNALNVKREREAFARDREALSRAAAGVRWWPAALAFLLLGVAYALVSERLTVGPRFALLGVAVIAVVGSRVLHWRGIFHAVPWLAIGALAAITAALTISAAYLVHALLDHSLEATTLLLDGVLLWGSNILTFALWYWEIDGGGPAHRHLTGCGSTDFAFPQKVLGDAKASSWMPEFVDYLFLAFNTNTAFSPTDTMVLGRRAKLMMMYQSVLALTTVVVLVARAINAI